MRDSIDLDWDIMYETVRSSVSWRVLNQYLEKTIDKVVFCYMRRSSSGNTHIRLVFENELTEMFKYQIRALLRDDVYRMRLDLIRSYTSKETNRLWDWKIKEGEWKGASEWEKIWERKAIG